MATTRKKIDGKGAKGTYLRAIPSTDACLCLELLEL